MASEDPQPMAAGRRAKSLTIVVIGATGGIGFATAAGLARLGHRIVVTGRDETRGPAAAEEWRQRARTADIRFPRADHSSCPVLAAAADRGGHPRWSSRVPANSGGSAEEGDGACVARIERLLQQDVQEADVLELPGAPQRSRIDCAHPAVLD
jgi:NAD(P)-dependent dehydrogenase (short-subunit alcohol dehydrogenase family)